MSKKSLNLPGQSALFEGDSSADMRPWQEVEASQPAYPINYGPKGSYVNVAERAGALDNSLSALGRRNQRLGFDVASHTRPHRGGIWSRYEELTPVVIEGAQRKEQEFLKDAKRSFWQATGFAALRNIEPHLRTMDDAEIEARAALMWRRFSEKYGDPSKRDIRDKYRRQLKKAIKSGGTEKAAA